jgi:hypothetical protein
MCSLGAVWRWPLVDGFGSCFERTHASVLHLLVEVRIVEVKVVACGRLQVAQTGSTIDKTFV